MKHSVKMLLIILSIQVANRINYMNWTDPLLEYKSLI